MEFETIILYLIIGYIFYRLFSGRKKQRPIEETRSPRGRINVKPASNNQSLIRNAQKQVTRGNFDEAASLYLRAGQVFTASKMKLFKGPQAASETLELIQINAPARFDVILDNLVNEFYFRLNKPAISIALLRQAGYVDRAEAIEVATGVAAPVTVTEDFVTTSAAEPIQVQQVVEPEVIDETPSVEFNVDDAKPVQEGELDDFLETTLDKKSDPTSTVKSNVSNSLHMATAQLETPCLVCKKPIKSGDPFIYCIQCGKPGHYRDFGEMMKVTGKCPNCRERVVISMYNLE